MERYVFKILEVAEVAPDFPFCLRPQTNAEPVSGERLRTSVEKYGILQPLMVAGKKPHCLVAGHKRFAAAKALGLRTISALILETGFSEPELFVISILSNWGRALPDLECATAIRMAVEKYGMGSLRVCEEILPSLGLKPETHFFEEYLETAKLHPALLEAIVAGRLPFKGARALARLESSVQEAFASQIAGRCALTTNQVLKMAEWFFDLLKRHAWKALWESGGFEEILAKEADRRTRGELFFTALRRLRFPKLALQEQKFKTFHDRLSQTEPSLKVRAAEGFESEGIWLEARLKDRQALEKVLKALGEKRNLIHEFFDIML